MKTFALSLAVVLFVSISAATFAQDNYVPKPNEEFYGTWTSTSYPEKTVNFLEGYKEYASIDDTKPVVENREEIVAKWADDEGNIWYKTVFTAKDGWWAGSTVLALHRISKSGTVRESVTRRISGAYSPRLEVLMEIDPGDYTYRIYHLAKR